MTSPSGKKRTSVTPEEHELFLAAVSDARPLRDPDHKRIPRPAPALQRARGSRPQTTATALPAEVALTIDQSGERLLARAPGVSLEQVADLRAGNVHVEDTLDLHRLSREDGLARLRSFLLRARQIGRRSVLVIHGRGLHGFGHSPMRDAVRSELLGPLSGLVHATASAGRNDGGEGATYVVLRSNA
jgi:DNA-nicking Smr family endonuclease